MQVFYSQENMYNILVGTTPQARHQRIIPTTIAWLRHFYHCQGSYHAANSNCASLSGFHLVLTRALCYTWILSDSVLYRWRSARLIFYFIVKACALCENATQILAAFVSKIIFFFFIDYIQWFEDLLFYEFVNDTFYKSVFMFYRWMDMFSLNWLIQGKLLIL